MVVVTEAQSIREKTKEYIPKALYAVSSGMCLLGIWPDGHIHNPYNTLKLGCAYLTGREVPKEGNVHAAKEFRNVMILFGLCLAVPLVYNSVKESGISLGDLLFDGGMWVAAIGAEIERRNLENFVETQEDLPTVG